MEETYRSTMGFGGKWVVQERNSFGEWDTVEVVGTPEEAEERAQMLNSVAMRRSL